MRVAIQAPWLPRPHGGMTVLFAYGNGLVRRGHDVTMVLTRMGHGVPEGVKTAAEVRALEWLPVDDGLACIDGSDASLVEALDADALIRFTADPLAGEPLWQNRLGPREFMVVQALKVLPPEFEDALLDYPATKLCVARWLVDAVEARHETNGLSFPVVHLPSGIDHDRFVAPAPGQERDIDVLLIYNPAPTKAARVGFGATELVRRHHPGQRVEMFGAFSRPDWLSGHVEYHHQPDPAELVELYRRSKVFLLSSALEGFGLASIEAMACGATLVTTDNGGSADYAVDGHNALVAAAGDRSGLAANVQRLLADSEYRAELALRGMETATGYRWEETIDRLEALLDV